MENFDLGIAYFHSHRERLEELKKGSDEERQILLTFDLLIENEWRYKARAEFILKNNFLQMQFGNFRIEYFIRDSFVTFSYSEDNGLNYYSAHVRPLNGHHESDIETIAEVIAGGEALLLLAA